MRRQHPDVARPEHTIHLDGSDERPTLRLTCGGSHVASITFGEPTRERIQRWTRRVAQQHNAAGCLAEGEQERDLSEFLNQGDLT